MSWRDEAACRPYPTAMFFPSRGDNAAVAAAKAVCESCPVRESCRQEALHTGVRYGVWGGLTDNGLRRARVGMGRKQEERGARRQREAIRLSEQGWNRQKIAVRLGVSERSVMEYLAPRNRRKGAA